MKTGVVFWRLSRKGRERVYPSAEGRLYGRGLTLEITRYRGRGDRVHEAVNGHDINVSFWYGRRE
jgi:hypothetical protein